MSTLFQILGYILLFPVMLLDVVFHLVSAMLFGGESPEAPSDSSGLASVPRGPATKTHGAPRSVTKQPLVETYRHCGTIYDMIQTSVQTYGSSRVAMRSRRFLDTKKLKETDRFPTKIFDDEAGFDDIDYKQLGDRISYFGRGLRKLGMTPIPNHTEKDSFESLDGDFKMVIFESTCAAWTIALQGAFSQSMTVATCYATLGHNAVVSAVQETKAATLMVNWKDVSSFVERAAEMPSLKIIIASLNELGSNKFTPSDFAHKSIKIVTTDQVMEMGKDHSCQSTPPKPSDVAVIMYTSGSTSKPKGVVMRHSQLVAGLAGMVQNVPIPPGQETFVSYLPLAHILALQVENILLTLGVTLCYADPRDLATALPLFKPTIFAGVPKVYETLKSGLERKISRSTVLHLVFQTLVSWKIAVLKRGGNTPVSNLFFGQISKKLLGGSALKFAITGGGPIGSDLHNFVRACFNCPVVQGYALTETCVGGCFQALHDKRTGVVGPPVACVEVALQSEPDLTDSNGNPYLHTDRTGSKGEPILGRGEICMRGPSIASGYFKQPDKEAEAFDDEGFFHTGDIGQFTKDGVIQIIDRKKNLVKLKGGEYVALEAMETAFQGSKFVKDLCVVADGSLDVPLAIVCVKEDALEKWAQTENVKYDTVEDLAHSKQARQAVLQSMKENGKAAGLSNLELRIKDCCLVVHDEWKPGHGMTASMKLDRKAIYKIHAQELKDMYKRNGIQET